MTAVLSARKLSKWYGSVIAVNNVSFELSPGITALLGPNGAGKSTLISMFTGQLRQTRGSIEILGKPIWNNYELNLRIGLCHQYDNFYEDMTAVEFITLMARLTGFRGRGLKGRVQEELNRVGLEEKAWRRPIGTYSKGMRQRVKLAQAVMHDPELLFLDEPMTGLDPVGRHEIASLIREFAALGRSVLVSTHILHEVETLTDQILLIASGRVVAEGDVHQIRESLEQHPYTIKIRCDAPRVLGQILAQRAYVSSLKIDEGPLPHLLLQTDQAGLIFEELPRLAGEENIEIREISSPDDNLESVFDFLINAGLPGGKASA